MSQIVDLNVENDFLSAKDWESPETLDRALFSAGLFRTDPGTIPNRFIIVSEIEDNPPEEINAIVAALNVQRAILAICSCDPKPKSREVMEECTSLVGSRGEKHEELLRAEIKSAIRNGVNPYPPSDTVNYSSGLVRRILNEALTLNKEKTMEQLAIACDLSGEASFQQYVPINMYFEKSLSRDAEKEKVSHPYWVRNALAWLQKNPYATDDRLSRYLSAYEKTIPELDKMAQV